jgi:hypothetical protein
MSKLFPVQVPFSSIDSLKVCAAILGEETSNIIGGKRIKGTRALNLIAYILGYESFQHLLIESKGYQAPKNKSWVSALSVCFPKIIDRYIARIGKINSHLASSIVQCALYSEIYKEKKRIFVIYDQYDSVKIEGLNSLISYFREHYTSSIRVAAVSAAPDILNSLNIDVGSTSIKSHYSDDSDVLIFDMNLDESGMRGKNSLTPAMVAEALKSNRIVTFFCDYEQSEEVINELFDEIDISDVLIETYSLNSEPLSKQSILQFPFQGKLQFTGDLSYCYADIARFQIVFSFTSRRAHISVTERPWGTRCNFDDHCEYHNINLDDIDENLLRDDGYCKDCKCEPEYFDGLGNEYLEFSSGTVTEKPLSLNHLKGIALEELKRQSHSRLHDQYFRSLMESYWSVS